MQLSKLDARIMRSVISVQQLELKLEQVSAFDYCSVLLPLVKSFMQVRKKPFDLQFIWLSLFVGLMTFF